MTARPLISIVIPTLNSEKTLDKVLKSIRRQTYPQGKIEILVVDGGSSDNTVKIAKRSKCKVVKNLQTELIYGKQLGFLKSKGKYLVNLDSDEVLENTKSLELKYLSFKSDYRIKAVVPSGYKTPHNYSFINYYINDFGDPFSFFIYRESKSQDNLVKDFKRIYKYVYEDSKFVVFDFPKSQHLPLIELWAGGCMIDLNYARNTFKIIKDKPYLIAHLFYLLNMKGWFVAITKKDPTVHYSSASIYKYLRKIKSRIKNNVFMTPMGMGGFSLRENFQSELFRYKKLLFLPYTISLIFPLIDSIYLGYTRRKLIYLIHFPLCIYCSVYIVYYYLLKLIGFKPKMGTYGN